MYVHRQGPLRHCKPAKTLTTSCTLPSLLLPCSPCNKHPHFPARPARLVCIHVTHTPPTPTALPPLPPMFCPHAPNVDLELFRCTDLLASSSSVVAATLARLPLLVCRAAFRIRFARRPHPHSVPNCLPSNRLRCFRHSPASVPHPHRVTATHSPASRHPHCTHLNHPSTQPRFAAPVLIFSRRFTQCHNAPLRTAPLRSHLAVPSPGSASTSAPFPGFCPKTRTSARRRDAAFPR